MKKIQKLRICDWTLLVFTVLIFVSSIQLEATGCSGYLSVWLHVIIGLIFTSLVFWHIYLHFGRSNWFAKFNKLKKPVTRLFWYFFLITIALGLATFVHWLSAAHHSPLGGLHGKIGLFLMLTFAIGHIIRRHNFFTPTKK